MRQLKFTLVFLIFVLPLHSEGIYWTTRRVLSDFFSASETVTYTRFRLDAGVQKQLQQLLGYSPKRSDYIIFKAHTGKNLDGYAIIDEEKGQHQPITFAVKFSANGVIQRAEVMIYLEGVGDEIRSDRFRRQFVGKKNLDPIRIDGDVSAVSGATISSHAMAKMVRRAVVVLNLCQKNGPCEKNR